MKKYVIMCMLMVLLSGCSAGQRFETVSDALQEPDAVVACQITADFPKDTAVPVFESPEDVTVYLCDGYDIVLCTLEAGDLDRTLKEITGFSKEKLTVLETKQNDFTRYDCVWSAAGEGGDQIGRAAVLDDGNYHYAMTVMANSEDAGALQAQWQPMFDSFQAVSTAP